MASALRALARRAAPALVGARGAARGFAKTSTGIVGLEVVPNGRAVLMALSEKLLRMVAELPESAHYRKTVEDVYRTRLEACQQHTEVEAIEAALGLGQIEELIKVAQDEEKLIPQMKGARRPRRRVARAERPAKQSQPPTCAAPACLAAPEAQHALRQAGRVALRRGRGLPGAEWRARGRSACVCSQRSRVDALPFLFCSFCAEWKPWEVAEGHKVPLTVDKEEFYPKPEKY
jgi:hypothetical protein